mmetsp:Transcript_130536/g.325657  ORF Transcript_130536/g.325657 Transcript_130536/m.325657 type:complete len:324 (+) Transcript_130536:277-1248(+)
MRHILPRLPLLLLLLTPLGPAPSNGDTASPMLARGTEMEPARWPATNSSGSRTSHNSASGSASTAASCEMSSSSKPALTSYADVVSLGGLKLTSKGPSSLNRIRSTIASQGSISWLLLLSLSSSISETPPNAAPAEASSASRSSSCSPSPCGARAGGVATDVMLPLAKRAARREEVLAPWTTLAAAAAPAAAAAALPASRGSGTARAPRRRRAPLAEATAAATKASAVLAPVLLAPALVGTAALVAPPAEGVRRNVGAPMSAAQETPDATMTVAVAAAAMARARTNERSRCWRRRLPPAYGSTIWRQSAVTVGLWRSGSREQA